MERIKMKYKLKYSGNKSRKFWDKISQQKNGSDEAYLLGVILQDFENSILNRLNNL